MNKSKDETKEVDLIEDNTTFDDAKILFPRMMITARENAGYTVERVALLSRISIRFLKALENGQLEQLPGTVFARGFIRNLSQLYNVDAKDLLICYSKAVGEEEPVVPSAISSKEEVGHLSQQDRYSYWSKFVKGVRSTFLVRYFHLGPLLGVLTVLFLVFSGVFIGAHLFSRMYDMSRNDNKIVSSTALVDVNQHNTPPLQSPIASPVSDPQILELNVQRQVKIEIAKDGESLAVQELKKDDIHKITFENELKVVLYDVSAVEMQFNGKGIETLKEKNKVRYLTFRKNGAISQSSKSF